MKTEKELNIIRDKILSRSATKKEIEDYFVFVDLLEGLVEEASMQDFYGTEGWKYRLGLE